MFPNQYNKHLPSNKGNTPQNNNQFYQNTQNTPNGQFTQTFSSNQQFTSGGGFTSSYSNQTTSSQSSYAQRIENMQNQLFNQHPSSSFQNSYSSMKNQHGGTPYPQNQVPQSFSSHLPSYTSPSNQYNSPSNYGIPNQQQYGSNFGSSPYSGFSQGNSSYQGQSQQYYPQTRPTMEPAQFYQHNYKIPTNIHDMSMSQSRKRKNKNPRNPAAHIPFNLQRANFTHTFSYEDNNTPNNFNNNKPNDDQNNEGSSDCPMRVSQIQSSFINNPYFYDQDISPPIVDKVKPEIQEKINEEKEKEEKRRKVFSFFTQNTDFSQFMILLGQVKMSGTQYTDEDFPPTIESLIGRNEMRRKEWGKCIWLRPDDFYGKNNYELFEDKIEPNDIHQGELGDCYFLSAISSLAEWPKRIMKIFPTTKANNCGCYCVKVCDMGEWKDVIIDDFFPCDKYTRKPIFTRGHDNELWVLILEKVWAKIYGSYDNIEAGLTRECLHDLTGAPTKFYLTDRKEEWDMIWGKIIKGEQKQYAMTAGADDFFSSGGVNTVNSKGIVASHAYSLLAAYEITHRGQQVRLVKLRNPWGKTEWKGDWSDNSPLWTPQLKAQLEVENKDDGIFYMPYEEFLKYFSDIQFCQIVDSNIYNYLRVTSDPRHAVYFKLTIKESGKYYVTVNQESKRKHSHDPYFKYSTVSLVVGRCLGDGRYEHVTGNNRADKEVWAKGVYTPGEYLVYAKVQWNSGRNTDFVLSTYGPGKAEIEVVQKAQYPEFLEQTFITKARESPKKMDYAREGEAGCFSVVDIARDGFIYCYYQNNGKRTLETEVYFKEFRGIKLRKPFRGREFKIRVAPGHEEIVLLRILPNQDVRQVLAEKVRFVRDDPSQNISPSYGNNTPSYGNKQPSSSVSVPNLDSEAKEFGEMRRIKDSNGNFTQMFIYQYRHDNGYYLLFVNNTKDSVLDQKITCDLQGLEPIGNEGKRELRVEVYPGSSQRVAFQKKSGSFDARFKFDSNVRRA